MTDTVDDVDLPYDEDEASQQEKIQALEERLEILEAQNEEMRDKLLDANAENNKYQQKLERLTHENKKLKQSRCSSPRSRRSRTKASLSNNTGTTRRR